MATAISQAELLRYSRQLMIPEIGLDGQQKLKDASVLIIGAGGLGSISSQYLAAAGVGHLGIVDYDRVDISNLQRQILYSSHDLGLPKVDVARRRLLHLNPAVQVDIFETHFTSDNAVEISEGFDILIDGSDNLPTRYLINDLCVLKSKPYVFGAVYQFEGQMALFDSDVGPCYRCTFGEPATPEKTPSILNSGVINVIPGLVGLMQAAETIKNILNIGENLAGKLILLNALNASVQHIEVERDDQCMVCGENPQITHLMDYESYCGITYSNEPYDRTGIRTITPEQLTKRIKNVDEIQLIDIRTTAEIYISRIPQARHIPYENLSHKLTELDKEREYILFCRSGKRSDWAQIMMIKAGFKNVKSLAGGINAWAKQIDNTLPQY